MNPENRPIRSIFTVMSTAIRTLEKEGRLTMEKSYIQHGSTSVYEHSVKVAYTSLYFARRFRLITFFMTGMRRIKVIDCMAFTTHRQL